MGVVWIGTAPILTPLPVKNRRSNFAPIDYVSNSFSFGFFGVFSNLIN